MKKIILILVLIASIKPTFAQGCSDAGICSIGSGFQHAEKQFKNNLEIATIFGAGEADVTYISPFVAYTRQFNDKFALSTKVTFSSAKGSFGRRAAFGDAYLIGNYAFKEVKNKQWSAVLGMKFPLSKSNDKINDYSIPLDYQASLGTFDLFLGTNFKYQNWNFNGTIQIPVFNINKNSFIKEFSGTNDFPTTNLFVRKSDVLFKSSYNFKPKNLKFSFQPNLLFIYHLGEDSYENIYGIRQNISGSKGLTINGNLVSTYKMNNKNSIELSLASPFVVRDIRPDGLTRKFVISINYKYNF
jgi:hypothetical protein